jgi:hypothetical protein
MLNEIILYGNPIVYNNVGYTPLIKKYLVERLGINVQRQRPLRPLRAQPVVVPQRESRMVINKSLFLTRWSVQLLGKYSNKSNQKRNIQTKKVSNKRL